jgi:hypothetical protein
MRSGRERDDANLTRRADHGACEHEMTAEHRTQRKDGQRRQPRLAGALVAATLAWSAWSAASAISPNRARADGMPFEPGPVELVPLENFSTYDLGTFPDRWKSRGDAKEAAAVYHVSKDAKRGPFLAARADGSSVMIGLDHEFAPSRYPYLQWKWRVSSFPEGGNELSKATNDSAAGVYVVFPGRLPMFPRVLKYVWSTSAPVGSRERSPSYNDAAIIVLASGPASTPDAWRTEIVNVQHDYESIFGHEAPEARGIGILTDGDATATLAAGDYADFRLLTSPPDTDPPPPDEVIELQEAARKQPAAGDTPAPLEDADAQSPRTPTETPQPAPQAAPDAPREDAARQDHAARATETSPGNAIADTTMATDVP